MKYVYPKLPAVKTTPFFRIGGNGLANCLFVYAKAIVTAQRLNLPLISPTWFNLSLGTYFRNQADKRHYLGLFNSADEINGLKKAYLLGTHSKSTDEEANPEILEIEGIYDFFTPLIDHHKVIREYLLAHIRSALLRDIDKFDFTDCCALHIRLGDFPSERRIPISWYINKIKQHPEFKRFLIFSDGTDEELAELLQIKGTQRVFFGGAIQDIIAISKCGYLIGSDSSFSAWGAFLGQVPSVFYRLQFGRILKDSSKQIIEYQ